MSGNDTRATPSLPPAGLPYAQPLADGEDAVWKVLEDFTASEMQDLIARREAAVQQAQDALRRLQAWQRERFSADTGDASA